MRVGDPLVRSLDLLRSGRNLTAGLEGRNRFQNVLGVFGLIPDLVRHLTALNAVPSSLNMIVSDRRLTGLLSQPHPNTEYDSVVSAVDCGS